MHLRAEIPYQSAMPARPQALLGGLADDLDHAVHHMLPEALNPHGTYFGLVQAQAHLRGDAC